MLPEHVIIDNVSLLDLMLFIQGQQSVDKSGVSTIRPGFPQAFWNNGFLKNQIWNNSTADIVFLQGF